MEEKKKSNAKNNAGNKKNKPAGKAVEETVEEVAVESTEETAVEEAKEVSEETEKKPTKAKKGSRRSGGNNKALEVELEKQKELTEEANDKYKRLLAEFENARNRNEKESKRMYDIGAKEVLEKLLPVVDNFERALAAIHVEDEELGDNVVAEELQKGYMYKDEVLRHSMVKVAN